MEVLALFIFTNDYLVNITIDPHPQKIFADKYSRNKIYIIVIKPHRQRMFDLDNQYKYRTQNDKYHKDIKKSFIFVLLIL